ncbi:MAG: radical SAM protein, partial [Kineosporiaceae bacterium]
MTGSGPVRGRVRGTVPFSAVDGPGSRYVVFLQGCGFDCLTCHNPATIPKRPPRVAPRTVTEVVDPIADAAPFLSGVTVTGGEPTVQAGFTHALLTELAARPATAGLHRLLDSNGDAPVEVWARLTEVCDGVVLDLKALDPQIHYVLTGRSNARVVTALRYLAGRGR